MAFGQHIRRALEEKEGRAVSQGTLCQGCGVLRVAGKNGKLPPHRCVKPGVELSGFERWLATGRK